MRPAREATQHGLRLFHVLRFPERKIIQIHQRIRTDDHRVWSQDCPSHRLQRRIRRGQCLRAQALIVSLCHIHRQHFKDIARLAHQLHPTRRL